MLLQMNLSLFIKMLLVRGIICVRLLSGESIEKLAKSVDLCATNSWLLYTDRRRQVDPFIPEVPKGNCVRLVLVISA